MIVMEKVLGETGAGIVDHFGLQGSVEVGSFSKALGVQGILAGSDIAHK